MSDLGSYIYAAGRITGDLGDVHGLRDAPLRIVRWQELGAIVSTVDLDEFGEAPLREHLEDLGWLEQVARDHDRVVRAAWSATGAVAPFRLATICRTDEAVQARLVSLYDELTQALDRVIGRSEWTVKAFLRTEAEEAEEPEPATQSGTAYLMRRRAELDGQRRAAVDAQAVADDVHRELAQAADAVRRLPPQDRRLTGYTEAMILNGAYLVDDRSAGRFRAAVAELAARRPAVRLTLDGPWPPYSFTSLESA
ncbi:GvpL/GvpF family gas vesicle protein [Kribbella hippodromi]|uniref:GvpL/GvpF family gas vesicle protein n=1 Tax=Kribbella hippodromi TaxID=434347 RepID=A0ABN2CXX3_9ACTN